MGGAVEQTKEIYLGRNLVDIEKVKKNSGVFFFIQGKISKNIPVLRTLLETLGT
jgi:hypothetical protein